MPNSKSALSNIEMKQFLEPFGYYIPENCENCGLWIWRFEHEQREYATHAQVIEGAWTDAVRRTGSKPEDWDQLTPKQQKNYMTFFLKISFSIS